MAERRQRIAPMILNHYSTIAVLALLILLIENHDILLNRNESFNVSAWKVYRKYLFVIIAYYLTDIAWGILESCRLSALLFADTTIYFVAMAAGVMYWTKYTVIYLSFQTLLSKFSVAPRLFTSQAICAATRAFFLTVGCGQ